jgi:chitodextrinase
VDDRRKPPVMSGTSTHRSFEGSSRARRGPNLPKIMFRSRRQLAAAAGFWVLLLAAVVGISTIPGASAASTTPVLNDGFESGTLSQWTRSSGMTVQQQVKYSGSWASRATSSGTPSYAYKNLSTPLSEFYYDGRFQAISQGAQNASLVRFRTTANAFLVSMYRLGNGKLSYYNPVTGVTTTGPIVTTGVWHELEVHVRINGTSSLVEVWLDGTKVITKTAESLGTTPMGRVYIGDPATGHTFDYAFDNEVVSPADTTPPSTPTGLTVSSSTQGSISLAWAPSTDNLGVTGYDVFRDNTKLGATPASAYTFTGLTCGRSYTLGVDAFDAAANTSGRASVTAATKPCGGTQPPDASPPSTPSGLTVRGTTQSSISLGWNASTDDVGVAGYHLFRNNSALGTTTATSYTFSGLACGTTYTLGVDAFDAAGHVSGPANITATSSPCSVVGGGGGGYIKTLDSTNATSAGLGGASNHCTLGRSGLGDTFTMEAASDRCTWVNTNFSHMHRHEVFEVSVRFDSRPTEGGDWENEFTFRPTGFPPVFGNANCSGDGAGGNAYVMLLNLYVNSTPSPDRWQLDIRGGASPHLADEMGPGRGTSIPPLDLGPVVQGQTLKLKFDVVFDYQHGAATVWKNDNPTPIYNNRDRPLGFHYDCDGTTDLSGFPLQMQHGVYRSWTTAPLTFTSSGFRFLTSEPEG